MAFCFFLVGWFFFTDLIPWVTTNDHFSPSFGEYAFIYFQPPLSKSKMDPLRRSFRNPNRDTLTTCHGCWFISRLSGGPKLNPSMVLKKTMLTLPKGCSNPYSRSSKNITLKQIYVNMRGLKKACHLARNLVDWSRYWYDQKTTHEVRSCTINSNNVGKLKKHITWTIPLPKWGWPSRSGRWNFKHKTAEGGGPLFTKISSRKNCEWNMMIDMMKFNRFQGKRQENVGSFGEKQLSSTTPSFFWGVPGG